MFRRIDEYVSVDLFYLRLSVRSFGSVCPDIILPFIYRSPKDGQMHIYEAVFWAEPNERPDHPQTPGQFTDLGLADGSSGGSTDSGETLGSLLNLAMTQGGGSVIVEIGGSASGQNPLLSITTQKPLVIDDWSATRTYHKGDLVRYQGNYFKANFYSQGSRPEGANVAQFSKPWIPTTI